jgi:hypothetical protein
MSLLGRVRVVHRVPVLSRSFGTRTVQHSSPNVEIETLGYCRMSLRDGVLSGMFRVRFPNQNPGGIGQDGRAPI